MYNQWPTQIGNVPQPVPAQPPFYPISTAAAPSNSEVVIGAVRPANSNTNHTPSLASTMPQKRNEATKPYRRDILDFDVFSEFHSSNLMKPVKQETPSSSVTTESKSSLLNGDQPDGANQSAVDMMMLDLGSDG